jgi:hypothetical protein
MQYFFRKRTSLITSLVMAWLLGGLLLLAWPAEAQAAEVQTDSNQPGVSCNRGTGNIAGLVSALSTSKKQTTTIRLVPNCTYTLTDPIGNTENGLPVVDRKVIIEGNGAKLVRSGTKAFRIFYVAASGDLTLDKVNVANGLAPANSNGGGLYNAGGEVKLVNSTFTGNKATNGGGLYTNAGKVSLVHTRFTENIATSGDASQSKSWGGGIYNDGGQVSISASLFSKNIATTGIDSYQSAFGGAIASSKTAAQITIDLSIFNQNQAVFAGNSVPPSQSPTVPVTNGNSGWGGGLFNDSGTVNITRSTFSDNQAVSGKNGAQSAAGGGVYNHAGKLVLDRSTVNGNKSLSQVPANTLDRESGIGGGVQNYLGTANITNSTIFGNSASGGPGFGDSYGGGVLSEGTTTITNSTISGNSARGFFVPPAAPGAPPITPVGGGVLAINGPITLVNSIVVNNTNVFTNVTGTPASPANCYAFVLPPAGFFGKIVDAGHNLTTTENSCGFTQAGSLAVANPGLDPRGLQWNGGPTLTIALLPNSPAINAGDKAKAPTTDQRGFRRTGLTDIGAFELRGIHQHFDDEDGFDRFDD